MFGRKRVRHLVCLSLCLPSGMALACGPEFPIRLLEDRSQTLEELPEGNFNTEVSRLGLRIAGLKDASDAGYTRGDLYDEIEPPVQARDRAEAVGLSAEQLVLVRQLRSLTDPHEALRQSASLPAELALYTAGAVAFNAGEHGQAADYFKQVLALPAEQRALRSTWAAYSLGRTRYAMSDEAGTNDEHIRPKMLSEALAAFRLARQLSIDGFSDPMALGIASLGEEARVVRAEGDWDSAISLYATQNLHGSNVGYTSLRWLRAELVTMPVAQLAELIKGKQVQKLMTASLISRLGWSFGEPPGSDQLLIKLLAENTVGTLDNADRLAALIYQQGRYDSAGTFLEHAGDSGLAWWLRAKLALRDGDKKAAVAAYAKASQQFSADERWGERRTQNWDYEFVQPKCRVEAESSILALERGDYVQAFDQLYRSQGIYWFDAAAVAERVLTTVELKRYVDDQVPAPKPLTQEDRDNYVRLSSAASLRELLARRLLREGRYEEAVGYFDSAELQAKAESYGQYRQQAESGWLPTGRAQAYYQAAVLARYSGVELLGYEMAPDYAVFSGHYSLEYPELKAGPLIAEGEVQRRQANKSGPGERFHYRSVATALANRAADHLPHSSQAFAAVLCQAAGWNTGLQEERAFYQRYVSEGAYVPWAARFGDNCEVPDFQTANKRYLTEAVDRLRSLVRPNVLVLGAAGVLVFGVALMVVMFRRKKS